MLKIVLAVFSLIMAFSLSVSAQKTDCSKTTDADIVKAIQDKMSVKYTNQMTHINISVKDGVVKVEGWAVTKGDKKALEKIAKKASCVKKVINKLGVGASGGCSAGQKQCGDICIDADSTCNIGKSN